MSEGGLGAPTRHPLDWQNPDFYDEAKLDAETRRIFDICHGCRRCFNLCDSFPRLFDLIDAAPNGELDTVDSQGFKPVIDACTLCDMCFMTKCPYVPPHEFNLDFPHLMLRHRAVEASQGKTKIADRELAKTDRNGKAARFLAPLANWVTGRSHKFMRGILEKIAGLDKNAALPKYQSKSFEKLSADSCARRSILTLPPMGARRSSMRRALPITTTRTLDVRRAPCWRRTASRRRLCIRIAAACPC